MQSSWTVGKKLFGCLPYGRSKIHLNGWWSHCNNELHKRFISHSQLTIEKTTDKSRWKNRPEKEDLVFGTTLCDHMLMVEWEKGEWKAPKIVPYQNLSLSPACSGLHYGLQCFEGMKAYKTIDNEDSIRLFRPDKNLERLSNSMNRLDMPGADFDREELLKCISELVRLDKDWIPAGEGYSLYIRPTVIATHKYIGLATPDSILLYVISSPVGPYYKGGFKPIRLTTDTPYVRAWPGGTGASKVGGNYASTMKATRLAGDQGYAQVLWLFGDNDEVTEVGAMNVFFFIENKETGRPELITPPLDRGDILPGVTRASIIEFAKLAWKDEMNVVERSPTMHEIREAAQEGRLLEAFGAGTAAVVCPISCIQYEGEDIEVPVVGDVTKRVWDQITGIQYGKLQGPPGWSVEI